MTEHNEDEAFETLKLIVSRAKQGKPYKHLLAGLKLALVDAPEMRKMIEETCKNAGIEDEGLDT